MRVTVLPHGTAAISVLRPPQTPHQPLRLGSGFLGMLFDLDPLFSACNGEMGSHGPGGLSELLLLVVALWEKVAKFHLALRTTAAITTQPAMNSHSKETILSYQGFPLRKQRNLFSAKPKGCGERGGGGQ